MKEAIIDVMDSKLEVVYFWTDSMINLQYINNEYRHFKVFIGNRIGEICESSTPTQWRFVPGKLNPADMTTGGTIMEDEKNNSTC